ncbi:hypothetical protein BH09ACT6_BH09ACT6_24580 [soil metagenome]
MPEDSADQSRDPLTDRLAAVEAQRDALQAELDGIANRAVGRWLTVEHFDASALAAMQQTLSWKVTKPLRAIRSVQIRRNDSQGTAS